MSPTPSLLERIAPHAHRRIPIFAFTCHLTYTAGQHQGEGITVSLSKTEIVIKIGRPLPVGRRIRLLIPWPAELERGHRLFVVLSGHILNSAEDCTVVQIQRYSLRPQSRLGQAL